MKITPKTTQLAFFLTVILVILRGILYLVPVIPINLNNSVYYLLSFSAELSYLVILFYLISAVWQMGYKHISIPLIIISLAEIVSFCFATFFKPDGRDEAMLFSGILAVLSGSFLIGEIWLLITTFRIRGNPVIKTYRVFAIILLLAHIGNTVLTALLAYLAINRTGYYGNYYPELGRMIYLLPLLAVFFIIQKISFRLSSRKVFN